MKEISFKDRDAIFGRLETLASKANMSKDERAQYRHEWKDIIMKATGLTIEEIEKL